MKFEMVDGSNANGTCLQGYVDVSYARLVKVFGKPNCKGDEYKTDAEWCVKFEDGTIATIYNYKDGKNYNGPSGTPTKNIRDWHVGGESKRSVELVLELL